MLAGSAGAVLVADQVTKQLALDRLEGDGIDLLGGLLTLRLTFNSGGAFGILPGVPWLFTVAAIVIGAIVLWVARGTETKGGAAALGLVLGGGMGNVFDRTLRDLDGGVVDFIDLHVWPLFNLADVAIVSGVAVLLASSLRSQAHERGRS